MGFSYTAPPPVVLVSSLGDYIAPAPESSHVFNFAAVDYDDDSIIVIDFDLTATLQFALGLRINGVAGNNYFTDGRRISAGVETIIDLNSQNTIQIGSTSIFLGADNGAGGRIMIFLNRSGGLRRPFVVSTIGGNIGGNEQISGHINQNQATISSVELLTSASTWQTNGRITVYKRARS